MMRIWLSSSTLETEFLFMIVPSWACLPLPSSKHDSDISWISFQPFSWSWKLCISPLAPRIQFKCCFSLLLHREPTGYILSAFAMEERPIKHVVENLRGLLVHWNWPVQWAACFSPYCKHVNSGLVMLKPWRPALWKLNLFFHTNIGWI